MACAASGESCAAVQWVLPFQTHHATEASACASSSKIAMPSIGVRSSPPYAAGRKMRKNPARANSRARSSGSRRDASIASRCDRMCGRNSRAVARSSAPFAASAITPPPVPAFPRSSSLADRRIYLESRTIVPAKARTHASEAGEAGEAERWVPAFAGTRSIHSRRKVTTRTSRWPGCAGSSGVTGVTP